MVMAGIKTKRVVPAVMLLSSVMAVRKVQTAPAVAQSLLAGAASAASPLLSIKNPGPVRTRIVVLVLP